MRIRGTTAQAAAVLLLVGALTACATTAAPTSSTVPSPSGSQSAAPSGPAETPPASTTPLASLCTSTEEAGFHVAYPDGWSSNVGLVDLPDCRLFGPAAITSADDPDVAVSLLLSPPGTWTPGPITQSFEGITILLDQEIQLGGQQAWVREFERTDNGDAAMDPGDRWIRYELVLPGDWLLTGSTQGMAPGPDYDAMRFILLSMMTSVTPVDLTY